MTKKWVVGLIGAFAVLALTGVGFAAFTATATVYGSASAAVIGLTVAPDHAQCYWMDNGTPYTYGVASEVSGGSQALTVTITNLVPGTGCTAYSFINNTGSIPLNLTLSLSGSGMCAPGDTDNCYVVTGDSVLNSWTGVLTVYNYNLGPGTYYDYYTIYIPDGFTTAPASTSFTFTYSGTAGV